MNKKIEEVLALMPFFKEMSGRDAEINVWNHEGVIVGNFPSQEMKLPFKLGYQLEDRNDPLFHVIATGKRMFVELPAEVFGESIDGYITPIKDGNEVVGCVTYVFSSESNKQITAHSREINKLLDASNDVLSNMWSEFAMVTKDIQAIHDSSKKINEELEHVQSINSEIQRNAKYSNILALNASIESARVGAAGKGFAVVSEEMRKFAKISSDSADAINKSLADVVTTLNHIYTTIERTLSTSDSQRNNVEEARDTLTQINQLSTKMVGLCKNF